MADPLYYVLLPLTIFTLLNILDGVTYQSTGLNDAMDGIMCPMPEFTGLWNSSGTITRTLQRYNDPNLTGNFTATLTCTVVSTPKGIDYAYGQPTVNFGTFFFIADYVSESFYKIGQLFFLIGTLFQPPTVFLSVIYLIPVFIGMYIILGYGIYKLASPFVGG